MANNSIGTLVTLTSYGESHGPKVGVILDGLPSEITVDLRHIQSAVDRRKPSSASWSTSRRESDKIWVTSGIWENMTTGAPIAIEILNEDAKSQDYNSIKDVYRPGHADVTYHSKYGNRDYRGGGRSSIRTFAPIVAAGDICRQFLLQVIPQLQVNAFVYQIGKIIDSPSLLKQQDNWPSLIEQSEYRFPNLQLQTDLDDYINLMLKEGDTLGGSIHLSIIGLPSGMGEPLFHKFQSQISQALFSINTVKALEFGEGFASASMTGKEYNDIMYKEGDQIRFHTNHAGGLLGGITNGEEITMNIALKPISSIRSSQPMLDVDGGVHERVIEGRHDVCAVPRAVPIIEAMTYLVLADLYLAHKLNAIKKY